jgi:hypothetical protein
MISRDARQPPMEHCRGCCFLPNNNNNPELGRLPWAQFINNHNF